MKDILDDFKLVFAKHGITISKELEEELFVPLRLIYTRMEGNIVDRKIEKIDNDFITTEDILGKMLKDQGK